MTHSGCTVPWCTSDHTDQYDDFDGRGSRFHWGEFVEHKLSPASDDTWERGANSPLGVRFVVYEDVDDGASEARACIGGDMESPAVTAAELRAYAGWLIARADELVYRDPQLPTIEM